jgi:hypothetical protein
LIKYHLKIPIAKQTHDGVMREGGREEEEGRRGGREEEEGRRGGKRRRAEGRPYLYLKIESNN